MRVLLGKRSRDSIFPQSRFLQNRSDFAIGVHQQRGVYLSGEEIKGLESGGRGGDSCFKTCNMRFPFFSTNVK